MVCGPLAVINSEKKRSLNGRNRVFLRKRGKNRACSGDREIGKETL